MNGYGHVALLNMIDMDNMKDPSNKCKMENRVWNCGILK